MFKDEIAAKETDGLGLSKAKVEDLINFQSLIHKKAVSIAEVHQMLLQRQQFESVDAKEDESDSSDDDLEGKEDLPDLDAKQHDFRKNFDNSKIAKEKKTTLQVVSAELATKNVMNKTENNKNQVAFASEEDLD